MSQNNRMATQINVLLYPMRVISEILIFFAIMRHLWKFPKYTDLYESFLILGGANIEISQTSLCCEARKLILCYFAHYESGIRQLYIHINVAMGIKCK